MSKIVYDALAMLFFSLSVLFAFVVLSEIL